MTPGELLAAAQKASALGMHRDALTLLEHLGDVPLARLWVLKADLHRELCETAEARRCLARAQALGSDGPARFRDALLMAPIMGGTAAVGGELADSLAKLETLAVRPPRLEDPVAELPWLDFFLAYRGGEDRHHRELLAQALIGAHPALGATAPEVGLPRSGPVRVGMVSAHLRDHTIGRLNEALVEGLGQHGIEVVLLTPDPPTGEMAQRLHAAASRSVVLGRRLAPARRALAQARCDVLHFTDLGMDPFTTWLALGRNAPVQTVTWGHPLTTGMPHIDVFFGSPLLTPPGSEAQFTERLVRLPDPMVCWTPPRPAPTFPRSVYGLPQDRRVYLCPQNPFKLHPDFDRVLGRVLAADTDGVVALLGARTPAWEAVLDTRLQEALGPDHSRVLRVGRQPRERYLGLLQTADVLLDPYPFAGGHTSLEGIAVGTPLVTLPTHQLRGRITGAWYTAMGLGHRVATSEDDYVAKAVSWARPGTEREQVRAELAAHRDRLFAHPDVVANWAAAFTELAQAARS